MNILELTEAKLKLSVNLNTLIADHLKAFKNDTGLSPSHITIDMIDVTEVGSLQPEYYLGSVTVDITL